MNDTLQPGEPHPSARRALKYIESLGFDTLLKYREAFASCAIEGNRLGEVCAGTMNRLLNNQPVSDRYVMGLALAIMEMEK